MTAQQPEGSAQERKRQRRLRRWWKRVGVSSLLVGAAVGAWAYEDAVPAAGLKGILPASPPDVFASDAFEALGPTWSDWSQGAAEAIDSYYKADGDVAAQKAALASVKRKLGVLDKALADNSYVMIAEPLTKLRGPLARRVALGEAIFATLEADPDAARQQALKSAAQDVQSALTALEADLKSIPGGLAWLPYLHADALSKAVAESTSGEALTAALNATKSRLAARATLSDETQKAFLGRPKFLALETAVQADLSVLEQPAKTADPAAARAALTELVAAIEDYEATSSAVAASNVRAATKKVSDVSADGGAALKKALDEFYFSPNLQIAASETFLNRLLSDARTEQGQVNDYVLGAAVGGWQTTSSTVSVDVKPADDEIKFDLVLSGTIQSNTAGRTDQATIYTSGYHTFRSVKGVMYDGEKFVTTPAVTAVNANNTTTGAATRFNGTLLSGIAQRTAMREAAARRGQAEAIAEGRITARVTPKFNEEVDKSFAKATEQIETDLNKGLKETGIYPDWLKLWSTGDQVRVASRLMPEGKLGGNNPPSAWLASGTGAALVMHESVVNNTIDQIGFAGKKMSEEELRAHLEGFLSKALSREFKFQAPKETEAAPSTEPAAEEEAESTKEPAQLVFAENDPVRIQFRDGELLLVIRAGLERKSGEPIPAHEIVVPLTFTVSGDKIMIQRDVLQIAPIEGRSNPIQQKVMNTRIAASLPDREVPGTFTLKGPSREVTAKVTDLKLVDGWIAVHVD
ncbi:hypothetical protein GC163_21300 [bacterium]|nr:hypothetical protein [bacterium]